MRQLENISPSKRPPRKRDKTKGVMARLFSNYYLTTAVAAVALILATFYAGQTTAISYLQIKRLAGLAILAKALKPDLIPIPIPMHLDKIPSFMKGHHKGEAVKPVFIPVPIHHYHTTQKVFKGLSSGKGHVIYTTPTIGGFGTNIYGGLGSPTSYGGSGGGDGHSASHGGSSFGGTGSSYGGDSVSSYGGSGSSYAGSGSGSSYLGSTSPSHEGGGHSAEHESYGGGSDSNLIESASTHSGSYSQMQPGGSFLNIQPISSGAAFFPSASASGMVASSNQFFKQPMSWANALPNGAGSFVQQFMPANFNGVQQMAQAAKAPEPTTQPAQTTTATSSDGRAKAMSSYFSTVPNGKGVMSASASNNNGATSWSSSSTYGGASSSVNSQSSGTYKD